MSDDGTNAAGEWFERVEDRLETAESAIQSNQRSLKQMGEDMGDLAADLDDTEDAVASVERTLDTRERVTDDLCDDVEALEAEVREVEQKLEAHKRAAFVDSVVSTFGEHGARITAFDLKDKDGAFFQGGGVELSIRAEAKDGDSG